MCTSLDSKFILSTTRKELRQVPKVIWQEAASPCHPSRWRMHSSAACAGQTHSPEAAGEQWAMHSCVGAFQSVSGQSAGICPPQKYPFPWGDLDPHLIHGFLDPYESASKRHLDRFSRFCTAQPRNQHTDTQTTLHVTYVAIGRIYALRVMRRGLNRSTTDEVLWLVDLSQFFVSWPCFVLSRKCKRLAAIYGPRNIKRYATLNRSR